ncbi:hypothetical protein VAE151_630383 [Vibrio aestuarianus]|nr:hypothetical protein VAE055_420384 [Vibrio aestuarianus]CAH8224169.1 hypothetical protein VAE032_320381 [Vibrio aestuarianus]CAH8224177.1 hypothetical protein VAE128_500379 [Vibrio aestuarianus]CAH8224675.1 hypothetical protein VAE130_600387 [Vibrio aestuarianus]CAH8232148.1 hypothetical protein VAE142_930384 [Vibrio aestuarianus]
MLWQRFCALLFCMKNLNATRFKANNRDRSQLRKRDRIRYVKSCDFVSCTRITV